MKLWMDLQRRHSPEELEELNASAVPRQTLSRRSSPTRLVLEYGPSAPRLPKRPSSSDCQVFKSSPGRWIASRDPSPVNWKYARLSPTPPASRWEYCKKPVLRQRLSIHPLSKQLAPTHQELRTISHTPAELKLSSSFSGLRRTSSPSLESRSLSPTRSVSRQSSPTLPRLPRPDPLYNIPSHRQHELHLRGEDLWRPRPFYRTRRRVWFHNGPTLEEEDNNTDMPHLPAISRARSPG
jgi:hypothetical protein